jgi:hypothetical protein
MTHAYNQQLSLAFAILIDLTVLSLGGSVSVVAPFCNIRLMDGLHIQDPTDIVAPVMKHQEVYWRALEVWVCEEVDLRIAARLACVRLGWSESEYQARTIKLTSAGCSLVVLSATEEVVVAVGGGSSAQLQTGNRESAIKKRRRWISIA